MGTSSCISPAVVLELSRVSRLDHSIARFMRVPTFLVSPARKCLGQQEHASASENVPQPTRMRVVAVVEVEALAQLVTTRLQMPQE